MNQVTMPAPPPIATMRSPPTPRVAAREQAQCRADAKQRDARDHGRDHHCALQWQPDEERNQRQDRACGEREEREDRSAPRRTEVVRVQAELLARKSVERRVVVLHEVARDAPRLVDIHAARVVDQRELLGLFFGILVEFGALEPDLVLEHLALRAHRDVLAGRHRQRARQQSRDTTGDHSAQPRARAGHAHDQARVRHEAVVHPKHRCAQVAAAVAAVPHLGLRGGRRHHVSRGRAARVVRRDAAHLHGRQHVLHAPRPEPAREHRGHFRAGRWRKRRHGPARFRAPLFRLAIGCARKRAEQVGDTGIGLAVRDLAVQPRGLLFLEPVVEAAHVRRWRCPKDGAAASVPASARPRRCMASR